MQADDITWNVISKGHCSFKAQLNKQQLFCRNEYNLTGLCSRAACPLANSQYATVREEDGVCYLYMKVVERSHYPNKLWEKVKLPRNMSKAVNLISDELVYWDEFVRQKCKARLVRIHQYLIRMRKLALRDMHKKLIPIQRKIERREVRREEKALIAAKLDTAIEAEILNRLKDGTYGDIYNTNAQAFANVVDSLALKEEDELEEEDLNDPERQFVADFNDSNDEDIEDGGNGESNDDYSESEDESEPESMETDQPGPSAKGAKKRPASKAKSAILKKKLRPQVEIEYEEEEPEREKQIA
uniref:Protein MAK16 homolog n=1 Tax=Rhabditophanes sp. KR3021 TaxID=114890 RepID=A0AC35U9G6_9BILA